VIAYRDGVLCIERVRLDEIARRFGTPCYIYSREAIEHAYGRYTDALTASPARRPALVCYSVKANSNLAVLALMARLGAGFDIVSGGELARVVAAGGNPGKTLFSGVGKTEQEISHAIEARILCLNLESRDELERVAALASRLGKRAPVAFRVNPDVDARTHPYISTGLKQSKFGIPYAEAETLYREAAQIPSVRVVGIGCHIGSQLLDPAPYVEAVRRIVALADRIESAGIPLSHLDIGGGIGIRYKDEEPPAIGDFISGALAELGGRDKTLIVDPGRSIVGNAGVLLTRIEYAKHGESKNFLVVDAAMNDLLRPALYGAWHEVSPVREPLGDSGTQLYDVVGPICESGDFLARDRKLNARAGDLLAILSAGAYGMSLASNYNTRPRAAEVMVSGGEANLVRRRERIEELYAAEAVPAW
jgi:diaminopimelate decarboxylase